MFVFHFVARSQVADYYFVVGRVFFHLPLFQTHSPSVGGTKARALAIHQALHSSASSVTLSFGLLSLYPPSSIPSCQCSESVAEGWQLGRNEFVCFFCLSGQGEPPEAFYYLFACLYILSCGSTWSVIICGEMYWMLSSSWCLPFFFFTLAFWFVVVDCQQMANKSDDLVYSFLICSDKSAENECTMFSKRHWLRFLLPTQWSKSNIADGVN